MKVELISELHKTSTVLVHVHYNKELYIFRVDYWTNGIVNSLEHITCQTFSKYLELSNKEKKAMRNEVKKFIENEISV